MLPLYKVDEVKRLLDEGMSQRSVAKATGVSRSSVGYIRDGAWDRRFLRSKRSVIETSPIVPQAKCPECGVLVEMPCRACRARLIQIDRRSKPGGRQPFSEPESLAIGLDLEPAEMVRYQQVRSRVQSDPLRKGVASLREVRRLSMASENGLLFEDGAT